VRRCHGHVMRIQAFDLTRFCDAIIPAQNGQHESRFPSLGIRATAGDTGTLRWFWLPTGTVCAPPNWWTCAGIRSSSLRLRCTSAGSSRALPAPILSSVTNCERCGGSSANRNPSRPHPHMLRHACGSALANKGHDTRALQAYLGHRNIQHTVRYTELSPTRFKDFWRD
jgi:integrase